MSTTYGPSSWLRFLPPVLWESEPATTEFSIKTLLLIFEKLLTGIDSDGVAAAESIQSIITRIPSLFDPQRTPGTSTPVAPRAANQAASFLDYLGGWVAADPPVNQAEWTEFQRRKLTADMARITRDRGLRAGLDLQFSTYALEPTQPRIVVDDSRKILICTPARPPLADAPTPPPQRAARITTLIAQRPLVQPHALAVAPDRALFIGDMGTDSNWAAPQVQPGLYVLPAQLAPPDDAPVTTPRAIQVGGWAADIPEVLVVDDDAPYNIHVVVGSGALQRLRSDDFTRTLLGTIPLTFPLSMIYDSSPAKGALIVLDSGTDSGRARLFLISSVKRGGTPTISAPFALTQVPDALSLLMLPNGNLLVGGSSARGSTDPGNFWVIDRSQGRNDPTKWLQIASPLLASSPANPLAAPTAMVREDDNNFLVLDGGLKSFYFPDPGNSFLRDIAQQSAVYRVQYQIASGLPVGSSITRVSEVGGLVYPTDMVSDHGTLYIADPGVSFNSSYRGNTNAFGIVVHFPINQYNQLDAADDPVAQAGITMRRQLVTELLRVGEAAKPDNSIVSEVTSI